MVQTIFQLLKKECIINNKIYKIGPNGLICIDGECNYIINSKIYKYKNGKRLKNDRAIEEIEKQLYELIEYGNCEYKGVEYSLYRSLNGRKNLEVDRKTKYGFVIELYECENGRCKQVMTLDENKKLNSFNGLPGKIFFKYKDDKISKVEKIYLKNGLREKLDGPAREEIFIKNGKILFKNEMYYVNGEQIDSALYMECLKISEKGITIEDFEEKKHKKLMIRIIDSMNKMKGKKDEEFEQIKIISNLEG